jgi:hypothetical protein
VGKEYNRTNFNILSAILDFKMAAIWNLCLLLSSDVIQLLTWLWYLNICFRGQGIQWDQFKLYVGYIGFQNGRHLKSSFAIISGHNAVIDLILVSKYMFWGHGIQWYQFQFGIIYYSRLNNFVWKLSRQILD